MHFALRDSGLIAATPEQPDRRRAVQPTTRRRNNDESKNKENTMQPLAILILSFALFGISSTTAAESKPRYGGFSPDADGRQAYLDYIHSLEMIAVEAGPELQSAVEAIPVEAKVPLTPDQEADLRDWLYDFLVAFSVSGSDSLAAAFYLREGVNNPDMVEQLKKMLESKGLLKGDTPLAAFKLGIEKILTLRGAIISSETRPFSTACTECTRSRGGMKAIWNTPEPTACFPRA